jgi:TRAP-type mannitol/chloroaromatic compound transport system substrate-binding protein
MMAEFDARNGEYLTKLINEEGVDVRMFPKEVTDGLKNFTDETINELVQQDEPSRRVYESFSKFKKQVSVWTDISEKVFYQTM